MNATIETDTNTDVHTTLTPKYQSSRPLYIFFLLLAATLLNGLDSSEFTGAANVIARDLHLTINDIGILASAFTILITISAIPIGLLADRAKRSHVIGACLAVWSLATALTGLATNFIALFLTRTLTRAAGGPGAGRRGGWAGSRFVEAGLPGLRHTRYRSGLLCLEIA